MTVQSKVRIYDLAKELKQESKRILEEVRREGVDVSVPSNTISKELAEKIRSRYYPKKEPVAPRTVRVVKKADRHVEPGDGHGLAQAGAATATALQTDEAAPGDAGAVAAHAEQAEPSAPAPKPFSTARLVKKHAPAARAEQPAPEEAAGAEAGATAAPPFEAAPAAPEADSALAAPEVEAPPPAPADGQAAASAQPQPHTPAQAEAAQPAASAPPAGKQVRVLRPTQAAQAAGIRHGERAPEPVAPPKPPPSPRERERRSGRGGRAERGGFRREEGFSPQGTPGETTTPQTVYNPPPAAGRPGRPGSRRGKGGGAVVVGARREHGGGGRHHERDYMPPPRALTPEQRFAASLNVGTAEAPTEVRLVEGSTVKEFAEKLGIKPKDVVSMLMQRNVFVTINQTLDDEVARDLGKRFGFEVSFVPFEEMITDQEFEKIIQGPGIENYVEVPRAPVVTVMGHVDHGKTSLLDAIRATDVAGGEAGGITQHIGAYKVSVPSPDSPGETRHIVFIDTPGHEAFTQMRARGAKVTDIVILVVAADDGVMDQTKEAIAHARAAGVSIVVAINKIDRPDANPDRVKQELVAEGLQPVEWGGDIEMVPVSAKRHENLDTLLETVLLTADIKNLRASTTRLASGIVLEAKKDKRGAVPTVIVQEGTLRVHDAFIVGQIFGRVRAMFNDRGERITEAGPSTPVEVLGLQGEPEPGDSFQVVADITKAQQISEHRQELARTSRLLQTTKRGIEALGEKEVKELLVVLKADTQGSVEVLKSTLQKLSTEQVKVRVTRSGVGAITESDVLLASATQVGASGAAVVIIGFNVRPEPRASDLAKQEGVDIRLHSIIYKVEEEIRAAMVGMLDAVESERIIGTAQVREVFRVPRVGAVAGCMVTQGTVRRNARARLIRDGVVAWEGGIASLRRFKDDVSEVREGFECGIGLEGFNDIKVSDQIEAYVIEKVAATEL